jgi:hypothetical protein
MLFPRGADFRHSPKPQAAHLILSQTIAAGYNLPERWLYPMPSIIMLATD